MNFEIKTDKFGRPVLKKTQSYRNVFVEGRGLWVEIGRESDIGIERLVRTNQRSGLIVLLDEFGVYRALVLTD